METYSQAIQLPTAPEIVNEVERIIDELKMHYQISDDLFGNILVAVTEAMNNAIHHGNKMDGSKTVDILVNIEHQKLSFTIIDQGSGFDYYNLPDPTAFENLDKPCGRGVFLMRHLADQVIFNDSGNQVELYFNLH